MSASPPSVSAIERALANVDFERALSLARAAREVIGGAALRVLEARALRLLGRHHEALEVLTAFDDAQGPTGEHFLEQARVYREIGRHAQAESAVREGLRCGGGRKEILRLRVVLAGLLVVRGSFDQAREHLGMARTLAVDDDDHAQVELVIGMVGLRSGAPTQALSAYRAVLGRVVDPSVRISALFGLARALVHANRPEEAVDVGRRAVEALPEGSSRKLVIAAWSNLALAHAAAGQPALAMEALEQAREVARGFGVLEDYVALEMGARAVEAGQLGRAAAVSAEVLPRLERHGNPTAIVQAVLLALPARARDGDAEAVHAGLTLARPWVAEGLVVDPEVGSLCRHAADLCGDGLRDQRAMLRALAVQTFAALGHDASADRELQRLRVGGDPVPVGPFLLDGLVGEGSMGQVYGGRHHGSGRAVALKFLRGESDRVGESLARERGMLATLDHPGIVRILDTGVVDPAAAAASESLVPGAPWVAMEWVSGGSLADLCGRVSWPQVRSIVASLLDALAHAHARGVLHLDLKPDNVILEEGRPRIVDFGLSRLRGEGRARGISGSPHYMAPEQFRVGAALSPATDLYAVGCIAFGLMCGRPPFPTNDLRQLAVAHQRLPPPMGDLAVPPRAGAWVARLLSKDPLARYGFAAEAARDLATTEDELAATPLSPRRVRSASGSTLHDFLGEDATWLPEGAGDVDGNPEGAWRPPEVPERPPTVTPRDASPWLPDAGWSLLRLRRARTCGREGSRGDLWRALKRAITTGRPVVARLGGPAGLGAGHLGRWIGERAHELGLAYSMTLDTAATPLVRSWWKPVEPEGLGALLDEVTGGRPVVVHANIGMGEEPDAGVVALRGVSHPLLVVLSGPGAQAVPEVDVDIALDPMSPSAVQQVVHSVVVGCSDALASALASVAGGSPGAALGLLYSLLVRGDLVLGDGGLELRPGAPLTAA